MHSQGRHPAQRKCSCSMPSELAGSHSSWVTVSVCSHVRSQSKKSVSSAPLPSSSPWLSLSPAPFPSPSSSPSSSIDPCCSPAACSACSLSKKATSSSVAVGVPCAALLGSSPVAGTAGLAVPAVHSVSGGLPQHAAAQPGNHRRRLNLADPQSGLLLHGRQPCETSVIANPQCGKESTLTSCTGGPGFGRVMRRRDAAANASTYPEGTTRLRRTDCTAHCKPCPCRRQQL